MKALWLLSLAIAIPGGPSVAAEARSTTDIYWADVDGGAATLIVTPAGESLLVDSGEDKRLHAARIHSLMKEAGLKQIDHFVISHWHADHYGGTHELTKLAPIRHYYANSPLPVSVPDDPAFPVLMSLYRKTNTGRTLELRPGSTIALRQRAGVPAISLRAVASDRRTIAAPPNAARNPLCNQPAPPPQLDDGENAKSLVLLLEYGTFRFLDVGDLSWHIEERLACPADLVGPVDLYQISHHGLDRSNNPHFVHMLRPRVVVVNNSPVKGAEPRSMKTVLSAPGLEAVWQLYENKRSEPKLNASPTRIANAANGQAGNYLKASIQPDGSFSVQAGGGGHREVYRHKR